ncbi:MAG: hypothetical protein AB1798_00855 [Spirochaetota bacterium]
MLASFQFSAAERARFPTFPGRLLTVIIPAGCNVRAADSEKIKEQEKNNDKQKRQYDNFDRHGIPGKEYAPA